MKTLRSTPFVLLVIAAALALQTPRALLAQTPDSSLQASPSPAAYAGSIAVPDPRKPLSARPGAYTLAQVMDLARTKNLTLLAAEQHLRAVKAQEIQAGVRQNPYFAIAASDITEPATENNPYSYA